MNKKYLMIGLPILALGLVMAGVLAFYGQISQDIEVKSPIVVTGANPQSLTEAWSNTEVPGGVITVKNIAPFDVDVKITNNAPEGEIEVEYIGTLELTKKTVVFGQESWNILPGNKVQIEYTIVGDEFSAEVIGDGIAEYELIYYADNADRFNNVAKAVSVEVVDANLPYEGDQNAEGGDYNYCDTKEYDTCHGAKIWYVPSVNINGDGDIDWTLGEQYYTDNFYFESSLVQYNVDGKITVYPTEELDFTPLYKLGSIEGTYTINTDIA